MKNHKHGGKQSTSEEIHGHAVLQIMLESGILYSRKSLRQEIESIFGEEARFTICSGGGMTAEELIDALAAKGKFVGEPDAFTFDPARMCNH